MTDVTFNVGDYVVLNGMYFMGMNNRWKIINKFEPNDLKYQEKKEKVKEQPVGDSEILYEIEGGPEDNRMVIKSDKIKRKIDKSRLGGKRNKTKRKSRKIKRKSMKKGRKMRRKSMKKGGCK